jgi:hypothetical protein
MPEKSDNGRVLVGDFYNRVREQAVPLTTRVSYFSATGTLNEEDLRDYLEDPLAALPPAVEGLLPKLLILLVPYLDKSNGKAEHGRGSKNGAHAESREPRAGLTVAFEAPAESRTVRSAAWDEKGTTVIALAVDEMEVAEYHYELYRHLASAVADRCPEDALGNYLGIVRDELANRMHGEVDEESWQHKQALLRRQSGPARDSKAFREYARHSFIDTLTLYLHGICCDIDVETGPRQLPSRHLRRRLKMIREAFPPPEGYAVFPEELDR